MKRLFAAVVDHPYLAIGIVVGITACFALLIPRMTTDTDFSNYIGRDDPAIIAAELAEDRFGSVMPFMVAVTNEQGIFNIATLTMIAGLQERFAAIDGVNDVTGPLNAQVITGTEAAIHIGPASPGGAVPTDEAAVAVLRDRLLESDMLRGFIVAADGNGAVISIELKPDADTVAVAQQVVAIVEEHDNPPDRIHIAGLPYTNLVLTETIGRDMMILIPLVIAMIALVLFVCFRSLSGLLIPFIVAGFSVLWAIGMMAVLNVPLTVVSFILPIILLAIGIADGIHVLNRYHEETGKGVDKRTAILNTMDDMCGAVVITSFTTAAGFLSLLSAVLIPQRQFGLFTAVGVIAAMVLSLVLIPALLALLKLPTAKNRSATAGIMTRALSSFERTVLRHHRAVLVMAALLFAGFVAGAPLLRVEVSPLVFLGEENPAVQGVAVMDRNFSGSEQVVIKIDTGTRDGMKDPALLNEIVALEEFLEGHGVRKTVSLADMVREMNQKFRADDPAYYVIPDDPRMVAQLLFLVAFQGGDLGTMALGDFSAGQVTGLYSRRSSADGVEFTRMVQTYLDEHFTGTVHGTVRAEMVGQTRIQASLHARMITTQITSLVTIVIAAGVIISLLFGSLVAGLIGLIPLLLTVAISFGVMAYSGTYLGMGTLMIASITIGIGIDYAVHFIWRFRRETRGGASLDEALQTTIQTSGRAIVYNALALTLGFSILLFSMFRGINDFGMLVAMTMVISTLSAFTVIPAIFLTRQPKFLTRSGWRHKQTP